MSGNFNEIFNNSSKKDQADFIKQLASGSKSISEVSGVAAHIGSGNSSRRHVYQQRATDLNAEFLSERNEQDKQQAQLELAYLKSAIVLAQQTNDLACMIKIGPFELNICDNISIVPVLEKNIAEIEKYLNGQPNSYE